MNSNAIYEVQVRSARSELLSEWAPEPPALTVTATVSSTEVTEDSDEELEISAQQTVQADLELSVNPASGARRTPEETDIEVNRPSYG